jgi:hypothetical protein
MMTDSSVVELGGVCAGFRGAWEADSQPTSWHPRPTCVDASLGPPTNGQVKVLTKSDGQSTGSGAEEWEEGEMLGDEQFQVSSFRAAFDF